MRAWERDRRRRAARRLAGCRTTLALTALLAIGGLVQAVVSEADRRSLRHWASTNLDNLAHHPVAAVVLSAFLPDGYPAAWVVLALVGLTGCELMSGPLPVLLLAVSGHLVSTAVSEGVTAYRVHLGALPERARQLIDIGPSYIVVASLVAAMVVGRWPARVLAVAGLAVLVPGLFEGLTAWDAAAVGHVCAMLIGVAGGWLMRRSPRRPPHGPAAAAGVTAS
jgi:hypothetical protein